MQTTAPRTRITVPALAAERPARRLPLLASAAPVLGSVAMWIVTGSPFALLFVVLGPVVAVAGVIDDRLQRRRETRNALLEHARQVDDAMRAIAAEHERERAELRGACFDPLEVVRSPYDPEWWRATGTTSIPLCLGSGPVPSRVELQHPPSDASAVTARAAEALEAAATQLAEAPVIVDARDGVGIVGHNMVSTALARSLVSQLAVLLSPAQAQLSCGADGCFAWARELPHASGSPTRSRAAASCDLIEFTLRGTENSAIRIVCAVAERAELLPRDCRVVVHTEADGSVSLVRNPSGATVTGVQPRLLSAAQGRVLAERVMTAATVHGLVGSASALPESVTLTELEPADPRRGALPATLAMSASGPITLDLVADGQHAIIGGTTGAGKSELLISWVLAMAMATGPDEVNFLLVDFKGGASFAPIAELPHSVGIITDLDQVSAHRALLSLRAELRHRERHLAQQRVRSIDELLEPHRLPRLVIVVDEYAVVVTEFPELQALFADLAARGRSLGVHLILCTQRPAGTVRDAVLANCSLRLSLRVTNPADSSAVIASPVAAELPAQPLGRCYLATVGSEPVAMQVALAGPNDAKRVRQRWPVVKLRRPWREQLPQVVTAADLESQGVVDGVVFGLIDVPEEQCWRAAAYLPSRDGNLVILGGHGSGKSVALAALARGCGGGLAAELVPEGVEAAWDAVTRAVAGLHQTEYAPRLYLIDDVDALVAGMPDEYQLAFLDGLSRLLREGPARGVHVVMTTMRSNAAVHALLTLCGTRLLLRMPNKQEHLLGGGEPEHYDERMPPGGGRWNGLRVHVALGPATPTREPQPAAAPSSVTSGRESFDPTVLDGGVSGASTSELAIVVTDAATVAERIRMWLGVAEASEGEVIELGASGTGELTVDGGRGRRIIVGDVRGWQANWAAAAAHLGAGSALFIGCTAAEIGSLSGTRVLPPLIGPQPGGGILRAGDGSMRRVQLPDWMRGPSPTAQPPNQGPLTNDSVS